MKLYKIGEKVILEHEGNYYQRMVSWDELVGRQDLFTYLYDNLSSFESTTAPEPDTAFDPPIGSQEIWAAGVTYYRSRTVRMEESKDGGSFYDKVYNAE